MEAKAIGLKMGEPLFQARALIEQHQVKVFSSNYALYGDMSSRVMAYLTEVAPEVEIYSVDEAFLGLHGMARYLGSLETYARRIRAEVRQRTHIPTCVGIAPTSDSYARKHLGGVVGARLVRELQGCPCHQLAPSEDGTLARQSIACTRTFGRPLTELAAFAGAVAAFASRAAEKLRRQGSVAHVLTVFISQNRFGPTPPPHTRSAQLTLPTATSSTLDLVSYANATLNRIWQPGHTYVKAGVVLDGFEAAGQPQLSLFEKAPEIVHPQASAFMQRLDQLNARFGWATVQVAAALPAQPKAPGSKS